jgi:hypothetical protein
MLSASLYIMACSARNRLRVRMRRLREPRYLVGAIVGAAYLYFSFFARLRSRSALSRTRGRTGGGGATSVSQVLQSGSGIVAALFLVGAAIGWVLPFNSAMLDFSDAEIAFLFPAPVTRRSLIVHRLLRSQLGLLFTAVITSLVFPASAPFGRVRWAIAMWVILTTSRVYFTGVTLARGRLLGDGGRARRSALVPIAVIAAAVAVVGRALIAAFAGVPPANVSDLAVRVEAALGSGAAHAMLWPFLALARPLFTPWGLSFAIAIAWALGVLAATLAWVLQTDSALHEAAAHAAARRAEDRRTRSVAPIKARATGLTLAPAGRPEGIFFWKSGVQTLRAGGVTMVRYLVPLVAISTVATSVALGALRMRGGAAAGFMTAVAVTMFVAILGPQVVRTDLRSDLAHLETLKTWPLRAADVIRGEMLWPSAMLIGIGWLAIACAAMLSFAAFPSVALMGRVTVASTAVLLLPALVAAQYLVLAAATVLLPAWVPIGDQRPRGLDAMGQRLIMLFGVLVTVIAIMLPGAITGGILWLLLNRIIGDLAVIPAAIACTVTVAIIVAAGTEILGPLFDQMDITSVERAE